MPPVPQAPQASEPTCESIERSELLQAKSLAASDSGKVLSKRTWENVPVSLRSPTPSEFGPEFHDPDMTRVSVLTPEIYQYLDNRGLEAFAVPNDGNCLYRALTFGPQVSKHDLARKGDAGYLTALQYHSNPLGYLTAEELDEIRTDNRWENEGIGEQQVKAAAEYLGVHVELVDARNLDIPLRIFPPTPIEDELHPGQSFLETQRVIPEERIRLLLYSDHYYPLLPKNSFPNAPRDSTRVVRLQSPFSESLDGDVTPQEQDLEKSEVSDLSHLTPLDEAVGKPEPEVLTTSRPMDPLDTDDRIEVSQEIQISGKVAETQEAGVGLSAQETPVKDPGLSPKLLGEVTLGFFAGLGVATTLYAVVKGGQALWNFFRGENRGRAKGRRRKRRMIHLVQDEQV